MMKTSVYFEKFSFLVFLESIIKNIYFRQLIQTHNIKIYYIEQTFFAEKIVTPLLKKFKFEVNKLEFKMKDIKDERGELIRIRIPRKDLFEIQHKIINSEVFKSIQHESWLQERLLPYINKGVIDAGIMDEQSASRALFIIHVVHWHARKNNSKNPIFIITRRPWFEIYKNYSEKYNISLFSVRNIRLVITKSTLHKFIRKHPKLYGFIKNIKYKYYFKKQPDNIESGCKLYIDGRGDVNLDNNGDHSDFFWYLNSGFPGDNILYKYFSDAEKTHLAKEGITLVNEGVVSRSSQRNYIKPRIKFNKYFKCESNTIKLLTDSYDLDRYNWSTFFKSYNVKIFFTWYKYSKDHIAIADAINDNNGISVIWQMALDGYESISCNTNCDISFCFSNLSHVLDKRQNSNIKYTVITGYLKDYAPPLLKERALKIRKQLQANGAKKIVFVIDENSIDDSRWHTGHDLQRDNYSYVLEKVLATPWLGVIFKPKTAKTLRNRLGTVKNLLDQALKTGRCYIYDVSGRHTTSASPVLAGLSADLCIHGHLSSGTAALECALEKLPTLLIDREGSPDSKLYELQEGKVVFRDWPSAIDAVMEHFKTPDGIPGFGDWSSIINDLDPFRDGKAAYRMGTYLEWLIHGFNQGLDKETIMLNAAEKYRGQWGHDKVITTH